MTQETVSDLKKALASFVIVLANHLPRQTTESMSQHLTQMGNMMIRDGETTVGTLTKDLASALAMRVSNRDATAPDGSSPTEPTSRE